MQLRYIVPLLGLAIVSGCRTGDTNPYEIYEPNLIGPMVHVPPTPKDFELDFLHRMSDQIHTEIVISQLAEQKARHAELRAVAAKTSKEQSTEIDQLKHWAWHWYGWALWPQVTDDAKPVVKQLRSLASDEFDEEFLQDMIKHRQESVEIARRMIAQALHSEARILAQNIVNQETMEIDAMTARLHEWYNTCVNKRSAASFAKLSLSSLR